MSGHETLLPLFPLPDVVHFPRTDLSLHVSEPRHRRLMRDLAEREEEPWVGVVLLKPGWTTDADEAEIFPGGTMARLVEAEFQPDGGCEVLLHGELRFALEREQPGGPYRQAVVRPLPEPRLDEEDAGIVVVRRTVLTLTESLAGEPGTTFSLTHDEVEELASDRPFEEVVNRIAAALDLPVLRKLQLLAEALPERALSLLSILDSRRRVFDLLRPYRHLAGGSELN